MTSSKSRLDRIDSQEDLLELQRTFAEIIRKPLLEEDTMPSDPRTEEMILSNDRTTPHGRLQFYARQYWWRIQGSFDEDFRTVKKLVSNENYLKLRDDYLTRFPSISYTLRNLGSRFPKYLAEKNSLLADAGKYDWAKMQAFEAKSISPLNLQEVGEEDFPSRILYLQPYVKLLSLEYPVNEINKSEFVAEDSAASNTLSKKETSEVEDVVVSLDKKETYLAIHRLNSKIYSKPLSKEQYLILKKFEQGIPLENLETELTEDVIEIIQQSFSEWMALNWLSLQNPIEE